jgi:hypothetical protein
VCRSVACKYLTATCSLARPDGSSDPTIKFRWMDHGWVGCVDDERRFLVVSSVSLGVVVDDDEAAGLSLSLSLSWVHARLAY